jgi:hypothetical protein
MAEIPSECKRHLFEENPLRCLCVNGIFTYLGVAFLVIGIVGDAINKVLGLEHTNWFIMAVGFWMLGIFAWFRGYYSALHSSRDTTQQKKD